MKKRSRYRTLVLGQLEPRQLLALSIDVGTHELIPNTAQQFIEIRVESEPGDPEVSDFLMRAQIGTSANLTDVPVFDCTGAGCMTPPSEIVAASWFSNGQIWDIATTTVSGGPFFADPPNIPPNNQHIAQATITFNGLGQTTVADGIVVRLEVDTTGINSGTFDLRLADTVIGSDSHFLAPGPITIPTEVTNGTIIVGDGTPPLSVVGVRMNDFLDPPDLPKGSQPTSWNQQRSDLRRLEIDFNRPPVVAATDLVFTNFGINAPNDTNVDIGVAESQIEVAGNTLVIDWLPGEPEDLEDGVYALEILGSVSDESGIQLDGNGDGAAGDSFIFAGNDTNKFYQLTSEWSGDLGVSVFDFTTFSYWFGVSVPTAPAYVDINFDDGISVFDFTGFSTTFGAGVTFPISLTSRGTFTQDTLPFVESEQETSEVRQYPAPIASPDRVVLERLSLESRNNRIDKRTVDTLLNDEIMLDELLKVLSLR